MHVKKTVIFCQKQQFVNIFNRIKRNGNFSTDENNALRRERI